MLIPMKVGLWQQPSLSSLRVATLVPLSIAGKGKPGCTTASFLRSAYSTCESCGSKGTCTRCTLLSGQTSCGILEI